ncbi:MAG: hypothetical protein KBC91_00120 [Candidatus Omnitrophica bacterium]|nr:hypothetical protein [Candidatus Omnitrophota bacterium]
MNSNQENQTQGESDAVPRFLESKPLRAKQATPVQKKQIIILSVLILFLVYLVFQTFAGDKKKKLVPPITKADAPTEAVGEQTTVLTAENDIFQARSLEEEGRASPFTRVPSEAGAPVQGPASLVLQGVLMDSSGSAYAVINEKIVKKGERMADKVITTIQSDSVTLRSDSGEEVTLRMKT